MRKRATLSVIMITLDEEKGVGRVLESVAWADQIVVVDSGSTDGTEEIVRRYTDHFHVAEWEGFGIQKQRALDRATGDWVLAIDADEEVSPELRRSIERVLAGGGDPPGAAGYRVRMATWMHGAWLGTRGWYAEWKLRLFRREGARFVDRLVHEHVKLDGPVGRLDGPLLHLHDRGLSHELVRIDRYSTLGARDLYARGRGGGLRDSPFLRGGIHFLQRYFVHNGFLYGRAGLMEAALRGIYGFLKYAKLQELRREEAGRHLPGLPAEGTPAARPSAPFQGDREGP
ncbi:MAG: glycosyltransferase family 2 protein [Gemmatimonadota bacterium]